MLTATMPDKTELNYEVFLEVTNVLNSQRDTGEPVAGDRWTDPPGGPLGARRSDALRSQAGWVPLLRGRDGSATIGSPAGFRHPAERERGLIGLRTSAGPHPLEPPSRVDLPRRRGLSQGRSGRMINLPLLVRGTCLGTLKSGVSKRGILIPRMFDFCNTSRRRSRSRSNRCGRTSQSSD